MKIDFKTLYESNFNINIPSSKRVKSTFEEYLKIALNELKEENINTKNYSEILTELLEKLEISMKVLEHLSSEVLDNSSSETLGDFLLSQSLEIDKILKALPEGNFKPFLKELVFFIGIEAQKLKQGYYS